MPARLLALAVIATLAATAPAAAATWSSQPTVVPSGALATTFRSVSCPGAGFCVAVGTTGPTFTPATPLVERWNGVAWAIDPIALPAGDSSAELKDVSCTSPRSCLAVGSGFTSTSASAAFGERWDGTRWTVVSPLTPPGALGTDLHGVSCVARRACVAVGIAYFPAGRLSIAKPLAERWDGVTWTLQPMQDPGGAISVDDISCSAGDACTAVGLYVGTAGGQVPLAERWDGTGWTVQATPAIPDQVYNQFSGVSCPRRRFCEAVGFVSTSKTTQGIAERWDGSRWNLEPTPGPLSGPSQLLGVTCGPRGRCSAVGEALTSPTGNELPLLERRTPGGWAVEPGSLPAGGAFGRLWGVSCSGGGRCTAAGYWGTGVAGLRPLAERRAP